MIKVLALSLILSIACNNLAACSNLAFGMKPTIKEKIGKILWDTKLSKTITLTVGAVAIVWLLKWWLKKPKSPAIDVVVDDNSQPENTTKKDFELFTLPDKLKKFEFNEAQDFHTYESIVKNLLKTPKLTSLHGPGTASPDWIACAASRMLKTEQGAETKRKLQRLMYYAASKQEKIVQERRRLDQI